MNYDNNNKITLFKNNKKGNEIIKNLKKGLMTLKNGDFETEEREGKE